MLKLLKGGRKLSEHTPGYENALTPEQWEYLCGFLKMDLKDVLQLSGPRLWSLTQRRADENLSAANLARGLPSRLRSL